MDHNPQGRRPHYHRGRRGPDRRGPDRRAPQAQDQPGRASGEQVDVEQIMRDIRARIAQRHGIELSNQQIQELAARRLEAVLDPRNVNPRLMEQLRRGAAAPPELPARTVDAGYSFEDTTLFESHRGVLRFIRRLLNPILKLFFNPNPLIHALHTQARLNKEAAAREAERERLQAEWNALHYEVLQRLVTEVSRVSIDMQSLALRVESLSARVDFNDKRVRSIENVPQGRSQPRAAEPRPVEARSGKQPATAAAAPAADTGAAETSAAEGASGAEGTRRRRRRRRGRRGASAGMEAGAAAGAVAGEELAGTDAPDDEGDEEPGAEGVAETTPPQEIDTTAIAAFGTTAPPDREVTETEVFQTAAPVEPAAAPAGEPEPSMLPSTPALPPDAFPAAQEITPASAGGDAAASRQRPLPQPTPPPDEPVPEAPVDQPDPGPPER